MKKIIFVLFLTLFSFNILDVDAANICNGSKYNELTIDSLDVEYKWELKFDENHIHYFEVTVANMKDTLLLIYDGVTYEAKENGAPFKINSYFQGGKTYELKLYGGYGHPCVEEYVDSTYLEIPKYNTYSELEECIEYEEFYLCNKWYDGEIESKDYFLQQLELYKASLEKPEEPKPPVVEKTFIEKIVDFYMENIMLTLPITVLIVVLTVVFIVIRIKRSRERVKINLNV